MKKKILVLTRYARKGASSRLRFYQYTEYFAKHWPEITFQIQYLFNNEYLEMLYAKKKKSKLAVFTAYMRRFCFLLFHIKFAEVIWIEKELFPFLPAWVELLFLKNKKFILDYDDATFHQYDQHSSRWIRKLLSKKIDRLMARAEIICCGNNYLTQRACKVSTAKIEIIPTSVDINSYNSKRSATKLENKIPIIGWIGTPSAEEDLNKLGPIFHKLKDKINFKVILIGINNLPDWPSNIPYEIIAWSESTEVTIIQSFDIGVMPLFLDHSWNQAKCGFKLIQYMACNKPVIASPVGINSDIVSHGKDGYLAASQEEWVYYLYDLLLHPEKRKSFGRLGKEKIEKFYSSERINLKIKALLTTLLMSS